METPHFTHKRAPTSTPILQNLLLISTATKSPKAHVIKITPLSATIARLDQRMDKLKALQAFALVSTIAPAPTALYATDCSAWSQFYTSQNYLEPLSIDPLEVDDTLNASEFSRGLEISTELRGRELWIDVLSFPGDAPVVTGTAAIIKLGV